MNSKPFTMPHPEAYQELQSALYDYYWLCFPLMDEGEIHDLVRGPLVEVEDTVRRLRKQEDKRRT